MKAGRKRVMTHTMIAVIDVRSLTGIRGGLAGTRVGLLDHWWDPPPPVPPIVTTPPAPVRGPGG
jgi:hypothetical protein